MKDPGKTKFEAAIVEKVKEIRLKKDISQETIASILDTTKGFIGQIETPYHASKYNLNHLNKLAKYFGCSPQDFIPKKFIEEEDWSDED